MAAPFEIVCSPYTVYVAPVGTPFSDVDEVPGAPFVLSGTSGNKNYTDTGVVCTHGQTLNEFTPAGSTTPRKVWRTGETLLIAYTLADVSPDQYAQVINDAAVDVVAAGSDVPGDKHFELYRGVDVATHCLIIRGISSVDDSMFAQYEVPCAYEGGSPAPAYSKQNPAELAVEWHALELTPGVFGTLRVQTALALA